jgi:predicted ribosomally synthesized peptide with SipW-like signal peptide
MRKGTGSRYAHRHFGRFGGITLVTAAFALISLLVVGATLAWFTAHDAKRNTLRTANTGFSVEAQDVFTPPAMPLDPGVEVDKRVGAQNTGEEPAFVRLMVLPTVVAADSATLLPASLGNEVELTDLNTADWIYGGDGYFYYKYVLQPGVTTTSLGKDLFTKVRLNPALDAAYQNATLTIEVKCESSDTAKWNYRVGWWGTAAAPAAPGLLAVDTQLSGLAA